MIEMNDTKKRKLEENVLTRTKYADCELEICLIHLNHKSYLSVVSWTYSIAE